MSEQYIIRATYKNHAVEVWPVERFRDNGRKVTHVFDILVDDGYWGTCFTLEQVQKTLTDLRAQIERGEDIWET